MSPIDESRRSRAPSETKTRDSICLIDADPDLGRFLTDEEHEGADRLPLPVHAVSGDDVDVCALLREANAFGVLVLDGMLVHRVRIGEHPALRLLGPGDMFWLGDEPSTTLLAESGCSALAGSRLALLGNSLLIGAHRFPRLIQGLFARVAEQDERAAAHLAMAELPRVDDRLMAMMWLLAERWGHVTAVGTRLPLELTHETLGSLIGARRPTVTLALRQLARAGRLVTQDGGWLILEPPPQPDGAVVEPDAPKLLNIPRSHAPDETRPPGDPYAPRAKVFERAAVLRDENQQGRDRASEQLLRMTLRRRRCSELRHEARERRTRLQASDQPARSKV